MKSIILFLLLVSGISSHPALEENAPIFEEEQKEAPCIQYKYSPTMEWHRVDGDGYYNSGLGDCRFEEIKLPFYSKDGEVFFSDYKHDKERLEGAKLEDFKILGADYSLTTDNVYYRAEILEGADSLSFELPFFEEYGASWISEDRDYFRKSLLRYGADNSSLYYEGKKIPDI